MINWFPDNCPWLISDDDWFPNIFSADVHWFFLNTQEEAKAGLLSEGSGKAGEVELGSEPQGLDTDWIPGDLSGNSARIWMDHEGFGDHNLISSFKPPTWGLIPPSCGFQPAMISPWNRSVEEASVLCQEWDSTRKQPQRLQVKSKMSSSQIVLRFTASNSDSWWSLKTTGFLTT